MVKEAIAAYDADGLRKYPDTTMKELVDELSRTYDLCPERIFVGIGSDDVLALAFLTYFNSDKPVLSRVQARVLVWVTSSCATLKDAD